MSITSVGASFGYIDPTVAAGRSTATQDTSSSDDSSTNAASQQATPPQSKTQTSVPAFAPVTAAALINVQAEASTGVAPVSGL